MRVLLTQDVHGLGSAGEVKEVAAGYARNYLIPKGLAVPARPGTVKMMQAHQKAQAKREARVAEQATQIAERMAALTLTFEAKAGPTGRLYGSVTTADIAGALEQELGTSLDRRKIMSDPLREVGEHTVSVQLSRDVVAQVQVVVHAEGAEETFEETEEEPEEPTE
jgi:large subunit ribosomal protein L9